MTGDENRLLRLGHEVRTASAVLAILLWIAIGSRPAYAGTYVMRNCDVPGHGNSLLGPWQTLDTDGTVTLVDGCSAGDGLKFTASGAVGTTMIGLQRPRTGPQSTIKFVKATVWYAARLAGSGSPLTFHSLVFDTDGTIFPGMSHAGPGAENLTFEQPFSTGTNLYKIGVLCQPAEQQPCVPANATPLQIRGMAITLSEDIQPIVSRLGGTLLAGGAQGGIRTVTYSAFDAQSGLAKADVLLDGTVIATRDLTTKCPYYDFTVCPTSDDGSIDVDTRAIPDGVHRLALRVQDAASNERLVSPESVIVIANPPEPAPAPAHQLAVRFQATSRSTLAVPYGRRVPVRGRLTGGTRAGALIDVLERPARRGSRELVTGHARTKADGTFSYTLSRHRPTRVVRFAYRAPGGGTASVLSRALTLQVRGASTLRASLAGRLIRYHGRILSGPLPKRGKRVRLEGRATGSGWTAFAVLRTSRTGRFSGKYRLRIRRPGVRLQIRAVVPPENGYPYLSSRSARVSLRVR